MKDIPLYKFPFAYARTHGEIEEVRASHKANIACKEAIQQAIHDYYRDNSLGEGGAREVLSQFGAERTKYVLANTVQHSMWDARYCQHNKTWATAVRFFEEPHPKTGDEHSVQYIVRSHPGLIDIFITQVRIIAGD